MSSGSRKYKRRVSLPAQYRHLGEHGLMHLLADRDGGWACRYCGATTLDTCDGSVWEGGKRGCGGLIRSFRGLIGTADHVTARTLGGTDDVENFVIACWRCNVRKGARSVEWIETNPS